MTFFIDKFEDESWRDWFDVEGKNDNYDLYGDMNKDGAIDMTDLILIQQLIM